MPITNRTPVRRAPRFGLVYLNNARKPCVAPP
jgi:hypothetical protein